MVISPSWRHSELPYLEDEKISAISMVQTLGKNQLRSLISSASERLCQLFIQVN